MRWTNEVYEISKRHQQPAQVTRRLGRRIARAHGCDQPAARSPSLRCRASRGTRRSSPAASPPLRKVFRAPCSPRFRIPPCLPFTPSRYERSTLDPPSRHPARRARPSNLTELYSCRASPLTQSRHVAALPFVRFSVSLPPSLSLSLSVPALSHRTCSVSKQPDFLSSSALSSREMTHLEKLSRALPLFNFEIRSGIPSHRVPIFPKAFQPSISRNM